MLAAFVAKSTITLHVPALSESASPLVMGSAGSQEPSNEPHTRPQKRYATPAPQGQTNLPKDLVTPP